MTKQSRAPVLTTTRLKISALDMLITHKVLSLDGQFSGTEKRVAAVLIDSFNRRTGQCDPGLNRIAGLLDLDRRTVVRAIKQINASGLIRRVKHGGKFHRNSYEPDWARFIELEWEWRDRMQRSKALRLNKSLLVPERYHYARGGDDTQTYQTNQLNKEPAAAPPDLKAHAPVSEQVSGERKLKELPARSEATPSHRASRYAAERRWTEALHERFSGDPVVYGEIIGAITTELQDVATEAELLRRGAGIERILREIGEGTA
jgi:hypothetical protein